MLDQPAAVPAAAPAWHQSAAPAGIQPGHQPRGPAQCAAGPIATPGAAAAPDASGEEDQALTVAATVLARREPVRACGREAGHGRAARPPCAPVIGVRAQGQVAPAKR